MGLHGTIVLYPSVAPAAVTAAARERLAASVADALVRHGLLRADALDGLTMDKASSPATEQHLAAKPPKGLSWTHVAIEPEDLLPGIGSVVYSDTAKSFWGETDRRKRDLVGVPFVDISVLSRPLAFQGHDGEVVLTSNVLVEFSYADARLSPAIHNLRDPEHPLLKDLERVLGSKIGWGVVSG